MDKTLEIRHVVGLLVCVIATRSFRESYHPGDSSPRIKSPDHTQVWTLLTNVKQKLLKLFYGQPTLIF